MIYDGFDFSQNIIGNMEENFDEFVNNILEFLPYMKYIIGTIFLIFGIFMLFTKSKKRRQWTLYFESNEMKEKSNKKMKKITASVLLIIFALGFYFNFLLDIIYSITKLEPPMLIFTIISMIDIVELPTMIFPLTPEWNSLTQIEQLILLMIGIVSIVGFLSFIYGTILILGRGFNGKHIGIKLIVSSIIIFFISGLSPGISLLIYEP